jgi:hypothetical protein
MPLATNPSDELRVISSLTRKRHHDPRGPPCGRRAEKLVGVAGEQDTPFEDARRSP